MMKTLHTFFSLVILLVMGSSLQGYAQGHGKHKVKAKHDKEWSASSHHHHSPKWEYRHPGHPHDKGHMRRREHDAPTTGYRHDVYRTPRYVYYRDYDVYFDHHRQVYISYTGRGWVTTTTVPLVMRRARIAQAATFQVDFYQDNLAAYLLQRRPSYLRISTGWQ